MVEKEELMEALGKWAAKLDDESYKERFKGFDKTLQFDFTDQEFNLLMIFKDETCTLEEGSVETPDIVITTPSDIIMGITNGEISPTKAFMGGKLKAKGNMKDMLKVQMLMK
ncbi:MAG TPA: SCP2 sterol-binding domain-containing protein [Candidatus Lokiarchaeia archaeon]|nr:SCP2 sterol-binding domain-containing protein [Candidatus Lokiarchaeia archaeon]